MRVPLFFWSLYGARMVKAAASLLPTALLISMVLPACAATTRDLGRATSEFEDARYEATLAWLDEIDLADMSRSERAKYAYLRGMAEVRLERRDEGLHWLRLARSFAGESATSLPAEWRPVLTRTLTELTPETATHRARVREGAASAHE